MMIEVSRSLPVNDDTDPDLSVDDAWDGLVEKASNPPPAADIPVAVTWHRDRDGQFDDYRVYYDIAPVYAS